jgi:sucrose phosphorylase
MELLARTGVGRDINRHHYAAAEIESSLRRPLVQKQIELIRLRNMHPAFAGEFHVDVPAENRIQIQWSLQEHWVRLHVDLSVPSASITGTGIHTITIPDAVDHGVQF